MPVKKPHKWSAKDGIIGSKVLDTTSRSKISADNGSNTSIEQPPCCKENGTVLYTLWTVRSWSDLYSNRNFLIYIYIYL